ncbi:MAG TPA: hypothetical protein RMH99_21025 [Sandaracinaceae bacterium LLY-WYZ-13_1]|nr:hypothetical protein [Sandaracinaceae bacterium LLY-WYZ-13_1]
MHGRAPASGSTFTLAVALAALALTVAHVALQYVPHTWIQRDGRFYTNVNVTLVERASVRQDEFAASWYGGELGWNRDLDASWSNVAVGRDGARLPKHPILLPLLSTPLFWAFGLHGTLVFNVIVFALIGAAAFVVARRHATVAAATFAGLALILATGIRDHAYDYHVDVLILALFAGGMAALSRRRGALGGLLLGATVVLRPTLLLWMPSLALIVSERRDWRTLGRALAGGAVPLVLFALSNWWLYGAPWWTGYNRVLVVVNGEPRIADVSGAFSVPLEDGLRNLWQGPYGVRHRLTLMAAAAPGLLLMVRRRPLYVAATGLAVVASVLVFAKYRWYGDRFLWPSCVLMVPALAVTFDRLGRWASRRAAWRHATVAAFGTAAIGAAHLVVGGPLAERIGTGDPTQVLWRLTAVGAVSFGLARAAERVVRGPIAILAPLTLVLLPGVMDRALRGGDDLWVAATIALAVGARHWLPSLGFAAVAGWLLATTTGGAAPTDPAFARIALGLFAVAIAAVPMMGRALWLLAPLGLLLLEPASTLGDPPLFGLALAAIGVPVVLQRVARALRGAWHATSRRRRLAAVLTAFGALLLVGAARRMDDAPFRIASYRGVREAEVTLGHVPCDFLAWEHLNWECATYDRGVHGEVGLATSQPLHVGGAKRRMLLISTQRTMPRSVRWDGVAATDTLFLQYAVPDEGRGGGTLRVWAGDEALAALDLPPRPDGEVHTAELDTGDLAGDRVRLELELAGRDAKVLVDGGFVR